MLVHERRCHQEQQSRTDSQQQQQQKVPFVGVKKLRKFEGLVQLVGEGIKIVTVAQKKQKKTKTKHFTYCIEQYGTRQVNPVCGALSVFLRKKKQPDGNLFRKPSRQRPSWIQRDRRKRRNERKRLTKEDRKTVQNAEEK